MEHFVTCFFFYVGELLVNNPKAEGPSVVCCPRLIIRYSCKCLKYLEAFSIRNLSTRHIVEDSFAY
jgi:hypothetical protein